jgi:hypothetical protein
MDGIQFTRIQYIYIDDNDTSNVIRCIQLMYIWRSMQIRIELVAL